MRQYVVKKITDGGVKWLDVAPERFPGWVASFARRHGATGAIGQEAALSVAANSENVTFAAPDGAVAECHPPFPPVAELADNSKKRGAAPDADEAERAAGVIAAHARRPRTVGVLLVRLGGYAAGVFAGYPPVLADAKTGSRPVHGRSAAGGWSQHRFARRREKQASEALAAAANAAADVFGRGPRLDAVVLGGDKRAVAELRADPRLAPYLAIAADRFLTVPDPRRAVLQDAPRLYLAVRIRLTEPTP